MKKGKLLSAFTSLALFSSAFVGALPSTASAVDSVNLGLSMTSEKTNYTLEEIQAGATARVYVEANGEFQEDNIVALGFKFDCSDWDVRPVNLEITTPNQLANGNGDKWSSFSSYSTYGEWTKDFPTDAELYEEFGIEMPIGYALKAGIDVNASNPPAVQITSDVLKGCFVKGSGSSIAQFDVEFPTDLEAGTYTIDFTQVDMPVLIDDAGHMESAGDLVTTTGITFTIGDSQPTDPTEATETTETTGVDIPRTYIDEIKLSVERVTAAAGDSGVTVNVYADSNGYTMEALTFKLKYDDNLTLTEAKRGAGLLPTTFDYEMSTNVYLCKIIGDTPAVNTPTAPIMTLTFDVAEGATGELPIEITPSAGLARVEALQSTTYNPRAEYYLDPVITNGAIVVGDVETTPVTTATKTTEASDTTPVSLSRDYIGEIDISVERVTAAAGDTGVTVNIYADSHGYTMEALTFKLKYDDNLTLTDAKRGAGLLPTTFDYEMSTNVYLCKIIGDTPAVNTPTAPIMTLTFDVAEGATGELPIEITPSAGLSIVEALQSTTYNPRAEYYLTPVITNGAIVVSDVESSPAVTTSATTSASTTTTSQSVSVSPSVSVSVSPVVSQSVSVSVSQSVSVSVSQVVSNSVSVSVSVSEVVSNSVSVSVSVSPSVSVSQSVSVSVSQVVSNSVSVSVSNSVSVSVSIVYSGVNSSAVSVSGSGATSTDVSLSISVDDDMVDADGNNIHWYFADYGSPEFKTDNIVVMNGEDDITDEVTIDFGDQTPETVYDGENFDYVVEFTVTYGDQTATGSINAKIGQRGDANCDHSLNARDAAAIARDLAQLFRTGTTTLTAEDGFALFLANVNEDVVAEGKETDYYGSRNINARDAALIARFLSQKFSDPDLQLVDLVVD